MRKCLPCRVGAGSGGLLVACVLLALSAGNAFGQTGTSSAIALTPDGHFLLCVNPDASTLTVLDTTGDSLAKLQEIHVGPDPESVAVHPSGNPAYVANAKGGDVSVVDLTTNAVTKTVHVGFEPMALAVSPDGSQVYVANSASDTLSVIDTATLKVQKTVQLGAFGTAPRAVAATNTTIYVAMFFGQLRSGKTAAQEGQDDQREGHVVAIDRATLQPLAAPNPVVLGPTADTGFNNNGQLAPANGQTPAVAPTNPPLFTTPTGAFPNQLAAIALHPTLSRGYVVSTAASPNGPFRFNSNVQGLISVFDPAARTEVTSAQTGASVRQEAPLNMNKGVNLATTPSPQLFMSNPVAMAWQPDGSDAWVAIQNSDLVVRLTVDNNGIPTVGAPLSVGPSSIVRVDLQQVSGQQIAGKAPRGVVINPAGTRLYVLNYVSRSVTAVDISMPTAPAIVATARATHLPGTRLGKNLLAGQELFYTGRGPVGNMSASSWGGCVVCHPRGRSDNVTWMFDSGPRQTISLDGTFNKSNQADQRILNWSAVRDENQDFELNTRFVSGGRGLIDDDRLFLALGGTSGLTPTDSALIEQFQQFTGLVGTTNDLANAAALPVLPGGRRDFAAATLDDGRVFIFGGRSGADPGTLITDATAVLEFNPRMNTLTPRSTTGFTPRHSFGAAAVRTSQGVRIYAVGGYAATPNTTQPTGAVEEYNPQTDSWRTVASLPTGVAQFGITVAGGINTAEPLQLIHVVVGNKASEKFPGFPNFHIQRFQADPTGPGTWSTATLSGVTQRYNLGAATLIRGAQSRVFIIGGHNISGTAVTNVDEYTAQAMLVAGSTHTALPAGLAKFAIGRSLGGSQIYLMGGVDAGGNDQTGILEYSAAVNGPTAGIPGAPSGVWATRANLSVARRGLQASTPPGVTNLLTVANAGRDARLDNLTLWIASKVRPARAPVKASDASAQRGRTLFGQVGLVVSGFSCASCHGGPKWTRSVVDYTAPPSPEVGVGLGDQRVIGAELRQTDTQGSSVLINVGTFTSSGRQNEIRVAPNDVSQSILPLGANGFNIPSLFSVHETAPYFYSGLAQTLDDVLNGTQDTNGGVQHHFVTDPANRADLIQFLRSIDDRTPIFP